MRLRTVSPTDVGYRRDRAGRGFCYRDAAGELVSAEDRRRIKALAIPPAWENVWICRYSNGHIQAVGVDAKGRRQYVYHEDWRIQQDVAKHDRVRRVATRLPPARRSVAVALDADGMPRERALAAAFRLLDLGYFRIGSDSYTSENGSFGLTTLQRRHVVRDGRRLVFEFTAKSGIRQVIEIADPAVLRAVTLMRRRRSAEPELLAWRGPKRWQRIEADEVNDYLKTLLGEEVSAKDFRTWHGTVHAAIALARAPEPASARDARHTVADAMRQVAEHLGNTAAVARVSYVDPRLVDRFLEGRTIGTALAHAARAGGSAALRQTILERAVLRLLA